MPKDPKSIGGQTNLERDEIERGVKALHDRVQVLRQGRIDRELAQRKEALPIDITGEKNDYSETKSASVEKAESSYIYSESIKSKEANIVEKGHEKYNKTTIFDFSEVNGTYFLPYEFRAIEIDDLQEQEQVAEESLVDEVLQTNDARNHEKDDEKALGIYSKAG